MWGTELDRTGSVNTFCREGGRHMPPVGIGREGGSKGCLNIAHAHVVPVLCPFTLQPTITLERSSGLGSDSGITAPESHFLLKVQ